MPLFIDTEAMSYAISEIIDSTNGELFIVSPFLDINEDLRAKIKNVDNSRNKLTFIYRENGLNESNKSFLFELQNRDLIHSPNLHAKCYYNQQQMVVGSMNLYDYSQKNNWEMGFSIMRDKEPELFERIDEEVKKIIADEASNKLITFNDFRDTSTPIQYKNEIQTKVSGFPKNRIEIDFQSFVSGIKSRDAYSLQFISNHITFFIEYLEKKSELHLTMNFISDAAKSYFNDLDLNNLKDYFGTELLLLNPSKPKFKQLQASIENINNFWGATIMCQTLLSKVYKIFLDAANK